MIEQKGSRMSLYKRLTQVGTLSEPNGYPDARFSLPSTINWMRSLALIVEHHGIDFESASDFFKRVARHQLSEQAQNSIFEQLLFALHQLSALQAMQGIPSKADVSRVGIVAWYYGIYSAASAMVVAQDGSFQDDHTSTARVWDQQIASKQLMLSPFVERISSLESKQAQSELAALKTGEDFALAGSPPASFEQATGGRFAYLSGSVNWWRWKTEENVRRSKEFRDLGVKDFRKKAAREIRDKRLRQQTVGFLHEAFRYRGKANYRDAIFLGYGKNTEQNLSGYIDDLSVVLNAFTSIAGAFCAKRLGRNVWEAYVSDLEEKRSFSINPRHLWS